MVENQSRLLTAKQLSNRIGVTKVTIYRMAKKGLIPIVPIGTKLTGRRFIEDDVVAALSRLRVRSRPPREKEVKEVNETKPADWSFTGVPDEPTL